MSSASDPKGSTDSKYAIEMIGIDKWFGEVQVLRDVNLTVKTGQTVAIIGPSGSGKSTLLRCINGLEPFQKGTLIVDDHDIKLEHRKIDSIRQEIGFVFQSFNLYPHMTATQNIELAPIQLKRVSKKAAREVSESALESVGLAGMGNKYPNSLSGGQQQRVAIARCLAMGPRLMLFDEPTSALDPEMIKEVLAVVADLSKSGMTLVIVTHEMKFAAEMADTIVFMDAGEIIETKGPTDFFKNPEHKRTKEFLSKVL